MIQGIAHIPADFGRQFGAEEAAKQRTARRQNSDQNHDQTFFQNILHIPAADADIDHIRRQRWNDQCSRHICNHKENGKNE